MKFKIIMFSWVLSLLLYVLTIVIEMPQYVITMASIYFMASCSLGAWTLNQKYRFVKTVPSKRSIILVYILTALLLVLVLSGIIGSVLSISWDILVIIMATEASVAGLYFIYKLIKGSKNTASV